jgi:ubiquinone/menaquinone biosynthesis C-methylase UbiE
MTKVVDSRRVRWYITVVPVLGRLTSEDYKFKVSLGNTVRLCLQNKQQTDNKFKKHWALVPYTCNPSYLGS